MAKSNIIVEIKVTEMPKMLKLIREAMTELRRAKRKAVYRIRRRCGELHA